MSVIALISVLAWRSLSKSPAPVAILRVIDVAGRPIPGATIHREGLRTKPGVFVSGWYSWPQQQGVPNPPVVTDANGEARFQFPRYVFEKVETGIVCLAVEHPDFVSDRPERVVDSSLPADAPLRDRMGDLLGRLVKHQKLVANPDPIILKKGGILKITVPPQYRVAPDAPLWGQVSGWNYDTSFWIHPGPGLLATRRLSEGTQAVRVVQFDSRGAIWSSDVTNVFSKAGEATELTLTLKRGVAVRGKLDAAVPRPVANGRVIVTVFPPGIAAKKQPPEWHAWTPVRPDGSFEFASLPSGDLEIAAICQGFINANGPGKFSMHYPQKHSIGAADLDLTIGMQPTARLEVMVVDEKGKPMPRALVSAAPNLRWGEWGAVILGTDLYDAGDAIRGVRTFERVDGPRFHDFDGMTDESGIAVLPNLPADVNVVTVQHAEFSLPVVKQYGRDEREAAVTLRVGVTNFLKLTVEPVNRAPIGSR